MGFKMPPALVVAAIACAGLGLVLQIVGVATTVWVETDTVSFGLFQACGAGTCVSLEDLLKPLPDFYYACRAFGILGVLVLFGCAGAGVLICFMENNKLPLTAAGLGFFAGVCCLIEFAVFAGKTELSDSAKFGYSFGLTIAACLLAFAAGVCFFLGKKNVA